MPMQKLGFYDNVNRKQTIKNDSNIWGSNTLNYNIFYFSPKDLLFFINRINFSIWAIYVNNSYYYTSSLQ